MVTDRLRANFNKELDGIANEVTKFISSAFRGDVYEEPEDDTVNFAKVENYLPKNSSFVFGRQFLTNNYEGINEKYHDRSDADKQHMNTYSGSLPLWLMRKIMHKPYWSFPEWVPINFWFFDTLP